MQKQECLIHQRDACVVDLSCSKLLCEKCALFNPQYKHHDFIDLTSLPQHARSLYSAFKAQIEALNINVNKDAVSKWNTVQQLAKKSLCTREKDINLMYDEMVAEIQRERRGKISNLADEIEKIVQQSNESVDLIVGDQYHQLYCKNKYLVQCIEGENFLDVSKELGDQSAHNLIASIEKELSMIELDIKQRLNMANQVLVPSFDISRRRVSIKEDLLISNEGSNLLEFSQLPWKTDRANRQDVKSEPSIRNPQTERLSTINSIELDMTASEIDLKRKNLKRVEKKGDLKNIVIKNTVKQLQLSNLSLNNREALDAIKRCTSNSFIATIDLSNNLLTSDLISTLKKTKGLSKYLKKIVMVGVKLNEGNLKKQGVSVQSLRQGTFKVGQLVILI